MQMIWDNQFDGRIRSDPHRHVADFLKITNLFQYGENQEEVVMLRTFPFSLCEEAKTWLNELNERTITSWNKLREAFISRYFSPAKLKRLLNDIHSFHQLDNETLVEAWIRLKEMLRICYGHGLTKGTIVHIFYHGLDGPTQVILDAGGIFLHNTPNEAFKILEDKKFEDLVTKINSEFLIIRKELKEMRDDQEMMREWMASQTKANERMKNQVVELKNQINQGLSNHQAIIQNLERQFEFLLPTKTLPPATNTKPRHEIVYKIPSIQNDNDKGDVKFNEEEETEPNPTMPNPNLIMSNSPTISPFLKDCTVHISYTQEKVFEHEEISNQVGDKELVSFVGIGNEVLKGNIEDTENPKRPNVSPSLVEYIPKIPYHQALKREISHLNCNDEGGCLEANLINLTCLC
ncbi:reverse transcriptase domain-containing protein [Tanacetum coccineum]